MTRQDDEPTVSEGAFDPAERDIEAPTDDAIEQSTPANPTEVRSTPHTAFEADDYDAIEQSLVVDFEEDY
jgi:hypothetical protein